MKLNLRPGLITFEGTEGAGKTTLIRHIEHRLQKIGASFRTTREPGGLPLAEKLREILLSQEMNPRTELFLYEAARAEHVDQVIRPALESGAIVLCDRYTDSSLAYQGHARGLPWDQVHSLNQIATQNLKPDLTFFLDIDPEKGLKRASVLTRFEAEGTDFQTRVREGFLRSIAEDPDRWVRLDAGATDPEKLAELAWIEITHRLRGAT